MPSENSATSDALPTAWDGTTEQSSRPWRGGEFCANPSMLPTRKRLLDSRRPPSNPLLMPLHLSGPSRLNTDINKTLLTFGNCSFIDLAQSSAWVRGPVYLQAPLLPFSNSDPPPLKSVFHTLKMIWDKCFLLDWLKFPKEMSSYSSELKCQFSVTIGKMESEKIWLTEVF